MKKKECAIVQDLLVLYEDDMLQEESKRMVEEHIRGCQECMQIYEAAGQEIREFSEEGKRLEERLERQPEDGAVQVMRKLKKRITLDVSRKILAVLLALALLWAAVYAICDRAAYCGDRGPVSLIYGMASDEIQVKELYRLANGDIYCTLKTDREIGLIQSGALNVPDNDWSESTDQGNSEIYLEAHAFWERDAYDSKSPCELTLIFATEVNGVSETTGEAYTYRSSRILYQGNAKSDKKILWERGQKVEAATEKIEKKAIRAYLSEGQTRRAVNECRALGWDEEKILEMMTAANETAGDIAAQECAEEGIRCTDGGDTVMVSD